MRTARLAISFLWLTACRGSSSDQAEKTHETQQSWEGTARLTTQLWRQGALPAEYARQVLDAAHRELDQAARKAEEVLPP